MSKKTNPNWTKAETVFSETDLKDAIQKEFGVIFVKGEIAKKIYKNIDKNPKLRALSNLTILGGIFLWPLLLVGLAGRALTATDFKNYRIDNFTEEELTLRRKKV